MNLIPDFPRQLRALTCIFAALIFSLPTLHAQETATDKDFQGFWELREPAGDTCVLIVKRGGSVSCFWSGASRTRIEKGNWKMDSGRMILEWESGHRDILTRLGESAINRASFNPGMSLDGPPAYEVRGVRVDSRLPGSLTVDRSKEESRPVEPATNDQPENIPLRNPFIGYWKGNNPSGFMGIGGAKSDSFFFHLSRGGQARFAIRGWGGQEGMVGTWELKDSAAHIIWPDGHREILRRSEEGRYELLTYNPSRQLNEKPSDRNKVERATLDEAQGLFDAGTLNLLTVTDIRGLWTPKFPGENPESIEIEGWGNAFRSPSRTGREGSDPGEWRLTGDRVIISWIDGSKDVIRVMARGFAQESFAPGVPVTGEPERTIEVIKAR